MQLPKSQISGEIAVVAVVVRVPLKMNCSFFVFYKNKLKVI